MIKINLHQRKVAVGVSVGTAQLEGIKGFKSVVEKLRSGGGLSEAFEGTGDLRSVLVLGLVYFILLVGGIWYVGSEKESQLNEIAAQIAEVDNRIVLLDSELAKTQGYEVTKKNLEADERKIRTKIETIQELIHERAIPPKILMSLSEAIPKEVWLSEFTLKDRAFVIKGFSNNMELIASFIKNLSETIYFKDVQLKGSKTTTDEKSRLETVNFELEAQRR